MDEQASENQPAQSENQPTSSNKPPRKKGKILAGTIMAVAVAVGLGLVERYWIAPAARLQASAEALAAAGPHPDAPDFSLPTIDGGKLSLSDFKGKVLMVDFWATWCGPCRIEIPEFVELQNRYRSEGLAIIGISLDDSPEDVPKFYKEFRMNYPVVMGNDEVTQLYGGIIGLPTTFLIGRDGRIYAKHTGATDIAVFENEVKTLLAAKSGTELKDFTPAAMTRADDIDVETPEQVKAKNNPDVPGIDLTGVDAATVARLKDILKSQPCNCGCKMTVLECRQKDRRCALSRKLAQEALDKLTKKTA